MNKKEYIYVRPHVAKLIEFIEKSPKIVLSNYTPISAYVAILLANERKAFIDQTELPPQYHARVEVIVDIPALNRQKRFYITNYCNIAIDIYCHRLFIELAAFQMEMATNANSPRKLARIAFLNRLKMSSDEIDEETVRRLVDFTRSTDPQKRQRTSTRVSNNAIVSHLTQKNKRIEPSSTVLSLFD